MLKRMLVRESISDTMNASQNIEIFVYDNNTDSMGEDLKSKTFSFLVMLMNYKNQLRINHWQTEQYSEHKTTDDLIELLDEKIDDIGETCLGVFGRPDIRQQDCTLTDITETSTELILETIDNELKRLIECFKETDFEGILSHLGDLSADINKYIYLETLKK